MPILNADLHSGSDQPEQVVTGKTPAYAGRSRLLSYFAASFDWTLNTVKAIVRRGRKDNTGPPTAGKDQQVSTTVVVSQASRISQSTFTMGPDLPVGSMSPGQNSHADALFYSALNTPQSSLSSLRPQRYDTEILQGASPSPSSVHCASSYLERDNVYSRRHCFSTT